MQLFSQSLSQRAFTAGRIAINGHYNIIAHEATKIRKLVDW
jgi:hypothetical protein